MKIFQFVQIPLSTDFKKYCEFCIWPFHVYLVTSCKGIFLVKIGSEFMESSSKSTFVKIQVSVTSGYFHIRQRTRFLFVNSKKEQTLKELLINLTSLNFYDPFYFLLFVCCNKSFGLKWFIVVFRVVLDMILIFLWIVSISFRISKFNEDRLGFQRGRTIKSNFPINGWFLDLWLYDLLRS